MARVAVLHHNDADGFASAYAAWRGLNEGNDLKFIPVQYGQPFPAAEIGEFLPEQIFILDFSYTPEILRGLGATVETLVVIDHHKTAAEMLSGLPELDVLADGKVFGTIFDLTKSGAMLSWEFFNPGIVPPPIIDYVQDRDLWRWELPYSREINAYIATLPFDIDRWHMEAITTNFTLRAMEVGGGIIAFRNSQMGERVKEAILIELGGHLVPCVNATDNISELGDVMHAEFPDAPFTVSYADRRDGRRAYSLRSRTGFDVSEVAKQFGGGGHPGAAGFTVLAPAIIL